VLVSVAYGLLIALFALSSVAAASIGLLFLAGYSAISFLARSNTALQTATPHDLRGRIMSVYMLLLIGVAPLGAMQLGALAHAIGAPHAVAFESLAAVVLLVILHSRRANALRLS